MKQTGRTEKWTHFGYAPAREAVVPFLAQWRYYRAPAGYVMELLGINISTQLEQNKLQGIIQIHQAHKLPSMWGIYPTIEDQDVLFRHESYSDKSTAKTDTYNLYNYELKEFTVTYRSTATDREFRPAIIIYYRYKKFLDNHDKLEYAVKQPRLARSKGLGQLDEEFL
jgi:hypothetical protein